MLLKNKQIKGRRGEQMKVETQVLQHKRYSCLKACCVINTQTVGPLELGKYNWAFGQMYRVVSCLVFVVLLVQTAASKQQQGKQRQKEREKRLDLLRSIFKLHACLCAVQMHVENIH